MVIEPAIATAETGKETRSRWLTGRLPWGQSTLLDLDSRRYEKPGMHNYSPWRPTLRLANLVVEGAQVQPLAELNTFLGQHIGAIAVVPKADLAVHGGASMKGRTVRVAYMAEVLGGIGTARLTNGEGALWLDDVTETSVFVDHAALPVKDMSEAFAAARESIQISEASMQARLATLGLGRRPNRS